MINIVIPMAGAGKRFVEAGYLNPKPFIDVCGQMMIERVINNLSVEGGKFFLIARQDHLLAEREALGLFRKQYGCEILSTDKLTEGAACTILLACRHINNDQPLLLANSDQIVEVDIGDFIQDCEDRQLDGSIMTFYADHSKWSYAKVDANGLLTELREKQVISRHATVGIYYYQRGRDFVNSAIEMIANNDRVNNEFYTAPAYNYSIESGLKIGIYEIKESQMFGLGTPEDLENYINKLQKNKR